MQLYINDVRISINYLCIIYNDRKIGNILSLNIKKRNFQAIRSTFLLVSLICM